MPASSLPLQRNLCTMKQNRRKEDKIKCQSLLIWIRYINRLSGNTNWQEYKKIYILQYFKKNNFIWIQKDRYTFSFFLQPLLDSGCVLALGGPRAAKIYGVRLAWAFEGGLLHMCITNTRQRNLSTNEGYRATFTKAQVGRGSGTEAGQYGSL